MKGIQILSVGLILATIAISVYAATQYAMGASKVNYCGDGVCRGKESQANCCTDCGCPIGKNCYNNQCVVIECFSDAQCPGDPANCKTGVCNNPGTPQANCAQVSTCTGNELCCSGACQTPACSSSSECGSNICVLGNTTECKTYNCINPGTCYAWCSFSYIPSSCTVGQPC